MANKPTQENYGNYTDNVRVKISEKYKPPPRIGLPMSYAQRLTLNKQIQDTIPKYEFLLEKTVVEKMKEWQTARLTMSHQLQDRLEKAKSEEKKRIESSLQQQQSCKDIEVEISPSTDLYVQSGPSQHYQQAQPVLMPMRATPSLFSNILTPIPLKEQTLSQPIDYQTTQKSPFNISDFEADTSSPFDNMELKSINEMEELAQVLKSDREPKSGASYNAGPSCTSIPFSYVSAGSFPYTIPNEASFIQPVSSLYASTNGYYYPTEAVQQTYSSHSCNYTNQIDNRNYVCSPVQDVKNSTFNNIPDIMRSLQTELDNTHLENTKNIRRPLNSRSADVCPKVKTKSDESMDDFISLPKNMQDMSKHISSMGFPLSRVARVCKVLGDDQKKVVEHLLAMSELLDLGFPESSVSKALLQCNNDRDKALDILIS